MYLLFSGLYEQKTVTEMKTLGYKIIKHIKFYVSIYLLGNSKPNNP